MMRSRFFAFLFLLPVLPFAGGEATAQTRTGTADKIVAVVGRNRIILRSELEQEMQAAGGREGITEFTDSMRCQLLQSMMLQKVLAEQAERDSLLVGDEELEAQLDNRIRFFIRQYGSKEELERQSGMTVYQIKENGRDAYREQLMAEQMQQKLMANIKVTPAEVAAFYNSQNKDSLPYLPASVEMGQIVIDPPTSPELDAYARTSLEEIRNDIIANKKDFALMASLHSDDVGSRDNGGRYSGITRNGDWAQEFITASFRLQQPGDISPVTKTQFGYHIIQLVSRRGEELEVRHILKMPQHTTADYNLAMARLDSARAMLVSGKMTFSEAVAKFSNDDASKMTGGMITTMGTGSAQLQIDQLDPSIVLALDSMKIGGYSQPQFYTNERGVKSSRILYLKSRTEPHQANLKDDYNQIMKVALNQKKAQKMEEWLMARLPSYYIKLDPQFTQCSSMRPWVSASAGR